VCQAESTQAVLQFTDNYQSTERLATAFPARSDQSKSGLVSLSSSVFIPKDYNGILGFPVRIVPAGFAMTSREWGVTVSDGASIEDRNDNACALFIVPLVLDAGGWGLDKVYNSRMIKGIELIPWQRATPFCKCKKSASELKPRVSRDAMSEAYDSRNHYRRWGTDGGPSHNQYNE
jgi:hypothetical protein